MFFFACFADAHVDRRDSFSSVDEPKQSLPLLFGVSMLLQISQYIYTAEFNDTNTKHLLEPLGKKRRENKQKNYRKKEQIWLNAPSKTPLWINASFPLVCSSYTETPLKWSNNAFYAHV